MSRLTSKVSFNRPSVLDLLSTRPAPLSPPETELEPGQPLHEEKSVSPEAPVETPVPRFRKISTLAYNNSGLANRDVRSTQKQQKWLVMVLPPPSLTREPPLLGHTLSSAPAGRFSNGILMPLFPTLYGQLTAIAREFNMPSTTGLCVYLQLQNSGTSVMTPRISDESWQILWGHFLVGDERMAPLPSHGLPISGHIEFDIDLRRAKWFNTWMGHSIRDRAESELMSQEHSMASTHWRGDSGTSLFPTEQLAEESPSPADANPAKTIMPSRVPLRHVPRPLILERRDTSSVKSFSRHPSRAPSISHEPPSPDPPVQNTSTLSAEPTFVPNALSPVVQEQEEPQTAKRAELDSLVLQWRESSVLGPASSALAAAGQPSLDPVNMPAWTNVELNLNDFAWSISSAGPSSESPLSPHWPDPLPSVHLQDRLEGSVCLTPSVCTSFGPPDYDWPESPMSCVSRRPSPDLGMRRLDYVCLTPTTATSWGPNDLPSPSLSEYESQYRAPSVDLGVRGMGSRPVTPSTATSWGPDDLPSPLDEYRSQYRAPSVDLGVRGMGSRPVTPSTATSWGPPDSPLAYPDTPVYVRTPDAGERVSPNLEIIAQDARAPVYPYYSAWTVQPWGHVWPYQAHIHIASRQIELSTPVPYSRDSVLLPEWPDFAALYPSDPSMERSAANKSQPVGLSAPAGYPFLELYVPVYPHNLDYIYPTQQHQGSLLREKERPATVTLSPEMRNLLPEWPDFEVPNLSDYRSEQVATHESQPVWLPKPVEYPFFNLYPSVYPRNLDEVYPAFSQGQVVRETFLQGVTEYTTLLPRKENLAVASAVPSTEQCGLLPEWPDFAALYPVATNMERAAINRCQPVQLPQAIDYPFLEIYPSVYPYNLDIYPAVASLSQCELTGTPGSSFWLHRYGTQVKKLLPEWPDFAALYPVDPTMERAATNKCQPVQLPRVIEYPFLEIYPTAYPYNLDLIYPPTPSLSLSEAISKQGSNFRIHGCETQAKELLPEWPDFTSLYPVDPKMERAGDNKLQPVALPRLEGYPILEIYRSVYPYNLDLIYPPVPLLSQREAIDKEESSLLVRGCGTEGKESLPEWPDFTSLYPADPNVERAGANKSQSVALPRREGYPLIAPYPAVYPYNLQEIYPDLQATPCVQLSNLTAASSAAMDHQPLLEYPDFTGRYPSHPLTERVGQNKTLPVGLKSAGYPFLTIYSPVYPFNLAEIYGPCHTINASVDEAVSSEPISTWLPVYSGYPNFNLYPASQGYPTFEIYPPIGLQESLAMSPIYVKLTSVYPVIEPYEPVYPYLIVYPRAQLTAVDDCLPLRPVSPPEYAPTTFDPQLSKARLTSGQQPDKQHNSPHSPVLRELEPLLASNTPMTTTVPWENHSTRRKPRRTHLDLHLAVFGIQSLPALSSGPLHRITPRRKPKRTHHDLHLLVFSNLSQEDSQSMENHVTELPSRSAPPPPPPPPASRQRSRSGTVSSRTSTPVLWPACDQTVPESSTSFGSEAEIANARFTGISRPPVPTKTSALLPDRLTVLGASSPVRPVPSSNTVAPPLDHGISGLPPSPAYKKSLVNRVRSISPQGTYLAADVATEPQRLDRSRSLSDQNRVRPLQHSTVLERAKKFALLEQGSEANITNASKSSASRPASKLYPSKRPFA